MTPRRKAEELVDKYLNQDIHFPYIDSEDGQCIGAGYMTHNSAKRCALIAVDEILNNENGTLDYESDIEYWQQVKQEIEKL